MKLLHIVQGVLVRCWLAEDFFVCWTSQFVANKVNKLLSTIKESIQIFIVCTKRLLNEKQQFISSNFGFDFTTENKLRKYFAKCL